jgi:enterochelin esterase-like enzyme
MHQTCPSPSLTADLATLILPVMKIFPLLAAFSLAATALAQPILSPEIAPNGSVTFRLKAPDAKEVQLHCEGIKNTAMQKDDQGVWSFTSEPLEPDIYTYTFSVDGVRAIDPANSNIKYNLLNTDSQVHVPGPTTLPWEINDVPRGVVHRHFYKSAVAGDERDFYVYTPPGYEASSHKHYPVLYLLHGFSDDASAWVSVGCANVILDNLIARHEAKPMLVVMPLGYGTMDIVKAGGQRRTRELRERNMNGFRQALLSEVIPQVEKAYHVKADRNSRAIAGLSMGGAEALDTGLNTLEKFAWVGAFSAGGVNTNYDSQFPKLGPGANRQLRLLWIACGKEDGLFSPNQKFSEWLDSKEVKHTFVESAGAHSFRVWRRYLAQLTPLLFSETKGQ